MLPVLKMCWTWDAIYNMFNGAGILLTNLTNYKQGKLGFSVLPSPVKGLNKSLKSISKHYFCFNVYETLLFQEVC